MSAPRKPREPQQMRVGIWGNGPIAFARRGDAIADLLRKADKDVTTSCGALAWRTLRGAWDSTLVRFRSPQHLAEYLDWQAYQGGVPVASYAPVRCGQCDACKAKAGGAS